jgi:hypothetical protein
MGEFDDFAFEPPADPYAEFDPQEALQSFSDDELFKELERRGISTTNASKVSGLGTAKQMTVSIDGSDVTLRLPPLPVNEKDLTLEQYQEVIYRRAFGREDSRCAACGSRAKVEQRSITGSMAATLVWMCGEFTRNGGKWIYMPKAPSFILAHAREFTILARWVIDGNPLIMRPIGEDTKTTSKGFWRPSQAAYDLVQGRTEVPRYAYSYKDQVFGYSDEKDDIQDIVNNQFDLATVLQGNFSASGFKFTKILRKRKKSP